MKNTFGNALTVTLFGESHGEMIGAVLDGIAPGIPVDAAYIAHQMDQRRPYGAISTGRKESDTVKLVSGVYQGKTTGTPICILIENAEQHSSDYAEQQFLPRPGHADYTAIQKFHGFSDPRGGGHFSGRLTAPLTAAGAIALSMLKKKGILIGTHIARCAKISDRSFEDYEKDIGLLEESLFAVLDPKKSEEMQSAIEEAAGSGDSVGGVLETAVLGIPAGIGEPWFDTVEGLLAHALYSIPSVKGVEFGTGFALADLRGSEANDAFVIENGAVKTRSNHNGGINGGITNGMPILFRTAVKPTPSIFLKQDTVDLRTMEQAELKLKGRHDPAIVHRARVVVDSLTALTLADLLTERYGTDWWAEA